MGALDCLKEAADEAADELKKIEAEIQEESKIDPYEKICIKRMLVPRVIWFDDFLPDFWFLIKNEHPLLSIRFASRRHPYTRSERFWNLLVCVCMSFFFAAISSNIQAACLNNLDETTGEPAPKSGPCSDSGQQLISLGFGGCVTVAGMILKACAECGCVQFSFVAIKKCCEGLGKLIVAMSVIWAIGLVIAGIVILTETSGVRAGPFIANGLISQGSSWAFNFVILLAKFWWYKRGELKDADALADLAEYNRCRAIEIEERKKIDPGYVDDRDPNSLGLGAGQYRDGVSNFVKRRMRGGKHWQHRKGDNKGYQSTADTTTPTATTTTNPSGVAVTITDQQPPAVAAGGGSVVQSTDQQQQQLQQPSQQQPQPTAFADTSVAGGTATAGGMVTASAFTGIGAQQPAPMAIGSTVLLAAPGGGGMMVPQQQPVMMMQGQPGVMYVVQQPIIMASGAPPPMQMQQMQMQDPQQMQQPLLPTAMPIGATGGFQPQVVYMQAPPQQPHGHHHHGGGGGHH